jgi:hypothetical protein
MLDIYSSKVIISSFTLILGRSFIVVLLVLEMEGEGVDDTSEALAMRHSDVIDGRVLIGRYKK